jgi:hypothetical protein
MMIMLYFANFIEYYALVVGVFFKSLLIGLIQIQRRIDLLLIPLSLSDFTGNGTTLDFMDTRIIPIDYAQQGSLSK